ncbi:uncharacterized protein LOC125487157 isoform X4 [Rhincodon typus]|uniref:uncharacterized protein LOC125487157 isoform X4 n=1 Tax=Rhincodon typus TaxID=259920 RepID=UPI00202F79B8|nr:uncharacterized protein LOC125487157 isoform X4 [Rhincodon typus]
MLLSVRILVCLFLYTQQGQGDLSCQINQKQLMIVAVVNEKVKISCEYSCHLKPQPDAVYVKTSFTLQYILGTICIILALYSVTATLVVLIKRKVCNRCKVCLMKPANPDTVLQAQISPNSESQQNNRSHSTEDTTEDAYMALQIHKVSVYSSLHNDRSKMQASSQRNKASTSAQKVQSQAQEDVYECVYDSF